MEFLDYEGLKYYTNYLHLQMSNDVHKVTWSELVDLRDSSSLDPGKYYRITDFITTTSQANTRSAEHQFDIIVLALSNSKISEIAKVTQHEDDTYFLNRKLESWEIKYCLDNARSRFAWASLNGKGVIYYMKDEFNNEAPYDFKNIQFKPTFIRDSFTSSSVYSKLNYINYANITSSGFGTAVTNNIIETTDDWYYTFTNGNNEDASKSGLCHDNIIEPYYDIDDTYDLSNIVISSSTDQIHGNKFLQCTNHIWVKGAMIKHNIFDECCKNVIIEGVSNGEFYDNYITSALNVILVHGHMWDNRLFSLNNSILYSSSHVKNNHFLGLNSGFKFLVSSFQNVHVFGYVNNLTVLPTSDQADKMRTGYLLSCVFHPYTSGVQIIGFNWLEKAIFQGPSNLHLQAPDYTKNYGNIIVYPGDYTDVGTITDISLNSDPLCEIKRNNSTTIMI